MRRDLLGNIKKVPLKSNLLQSFQEGEKKLLNDHSLIQQARQKNHELVKVIGLDPEQLFSHLDKHRISINKMPKFSNVFDRAEPMLPAVRMTVAG